MQILVGVVSQNRDGIAKLVTGVADAVEQTRTVLKRLGGVGDTARRIEKISDALALVALQTNMRAVSGSVEATRAGDAGAGFANVTSDIRKLARESAANAEAFEAAIEEISAASKKLLDSLVTSAPPKDRAVEYEKAKERNRKRFGTAKTT